MRFNSKIYLLFIANLVFCQAVTAQSTFDLEPPQKKVLPTFACAESVADGTKIKISVTLQRYFVQDSKIVISEEGAQTVVSNLVKIEPADDEKMVEHTYQVQVPSQVIVVENGKEVFKVQTRVETRTRRMTQKEADMRNIGKQQKYTVREPYFETRTRDGERRQVKYFRNVTRSKSLYGTQRLVMRPYVETFESPLTDVNFFNLDGSRMSQEVALERLSIRRPILLVPHDYFLEPYFQELVRPDTIVIHDETWAPIPTN